MKLSDIDNQLSESINEGPANFMSKLGNKLLSKLGSQKAAGKLQTQQQADAYYDELKYIVGRTGDGTVNGPLMQKYLVKKKFDPADISSAMGNLADFPDPLKRDQVRDILTKVIQLTVSRGMLEPEPVQQPVQQPAQEPQSAFDDLIGKINGK